ncbi:hypothetical protein VSH64_14020 [Amycolatopsis rhabdoformis]|uniref:Sigma-70 family RNA polymerase sigma factor n=1 Tax=Amycolatopsis rhabdoformis TaxID=1448059 RepID=A0ABZ1IGJ9_9PSEU|nr:hypothetical protein [Amycolatopsis rhabdoformis]WSE33216.1 hypothetical protein VSH64_14020 [Amycolatopsis rhabdoformis]
MDRDSVIDRWLRSSEMGDRGVHMTSDQLAGVTMVAEASVEVPECPDEVLQAWYMAITCQRRIVDQAEAAFIPMARRNGWSWERIAAVLGLPDADAARQRGEVLVEQLRRTHPSTNPQPWKSLRDL